MRLPFLAIAGLAAMLSASVAAAGDVQFDPAAIARKRLTDGAFDRAESCARNILTVNLYRGVRDRDTLVNAAASQCENDLFAFLARFDPKLADRPTIHAAMIASSYQQLDEILSRGE